VRVTYRTQVAWNLVCWAARWHEQNGNSSLWQRQDAVEAGVGTIDVIDLVVGIFRNSGYLISNRGREGGYCLFRSPDEITFGQVSALVEKYDNDHDSSPFEVASRCMKSLAMRVRVSDFLDSEDVGGEMDTLSALAAAVKKERKDSMDANRKHVFSDGLKARVAQTAACHGNLAVSTACCLQVLQIAEWRDKFLGQLEPIKPEPKPVPPPAPKPVVQEPVIRKEPDPEPPKELRNPFADLKPLPPPKPLQESLKPFIGEALKHDLREGLTAKEAAEKQAKEEEPIPYVRVFRPEPKPDHTELPPRVEVMPKETKMAIETTPVPTNEEPNQPVACDITLPNGVRIRIYGGT